VVVTPLTARRSQERAERAAAQEKELAQRQAERQAQGGRVSARRCRAAAISYRDADSDEDAFEESSEGEEESDDAFKAGSDESESSDGEEGEKEEADDKAAATAEAAKAAEKARRAAKREEAYHSALAKIDELLARARALDLPPNPLDELIVSRRPTPFIMPRVEPAAGGGGGGASPCGLAAGVRRASQDQLGGVHQVAEMTGRSGRLVRVAKGGRKREREDGEQNGAPLN
jgi:hypothetical protein